MNIQLVPVKNLPIRLGQFLKLADIADDGITAKIYIQEGRIIVNGEQENRRGRQLHEGDIVEFESIQVQIIESP